MPFPWGGFFLWCGRILSANLVIHYSRIFGFRAGSKATSKTSKSVPLCWSFALQSSPYLPVMAGRSSVQQAHEGGSDFGLFFLAGLAGAGASAVLAIAI